MRPERARLQHGPSPGDIDMNSALIWDGNWAWSLPLVVFTVIFHVVGLGLIRRALIWAIKDATAQRGFDPRFALVMGTTTLLATLLHALEAGIWAAVFWGLGAVRDGKSAMLYSLNAITTYGHSDLQLAPHWQLMGAVEALNGMLLFGLTTAFLYGVLRRAWAMDGRLVSAGAIAGLFELDA